MRNGVTGFAVPEMVIFGLQAKTGWTSVLKCGFNLEDLPTIHLMLTETRGLGSDRRPNPPETWREWVARATIAMSCGSQSSKHPSAEVWLQLLQGAADLREVQGIIRSSCEIDTV